MKEYKTGDKVLYQKTVYETEVCKCCGHGTIKNKTIESVGVITAVLSGLTGVYYINDISKVCCINDISKDCTVKTKIFYEIDDDITEGYPMEDIIKKIK